MKNALEMGEISPENPVSRTVIEIGSSVTSQRQLTRAKELFAQFIITRKPQWNCDSMDSVIERCSHELLNSLVWSEFAAFLIDFEKPFWDQDTCPTGADPDEKMNFKFNTIFGLLSATKTYCAEKTKKSKSSPVLAFWNGKWYTQLRSNVRTEMTKKAIAEGKPLIEKSKGLGKRFIKDIIINSYLKRMVRNEVDPGTGTFVMVVVDLPVCPVDLPI